MLCSRSPPNTSANKTLAFQDLSPPQTKAELLDTQQTGAETLGVEAMEEAHAEVEAAVVRRWSRRRRFTPWLPIHTHRAPTRRRRSLEGPAWTAQMRPCAAPGPSQPSMPPLTSSPPSS
ncbi:hypothetical protein KC19_1G246100 [Ceratodon purpureus]|uniref:Uncharacterized protein n=1 Tax=Ceratodon purpureus TaxID=3225 RepID=A0A8T0J9G1_CERPU|nr:hypothetical protein KC19_1G246100 [Ceratodon purpureus]